jgi:hypothetical protein
VGGFAQFLIILLYLCKRISQVKRFPKALRAKRNGVRYLTQKPRDAGSFKNNSQINQNLYQHETVRYKILVGVPLPFGCIFLRFTVLQKNAIFKQ